MSPTVIIQVKWNPCSLSSFRAGPHDERSESKNLRITNNDIIEYLSSEHTTCTIH